MKKASLVVLTVLCSAVITHAGTLSDISSMNAGAFPRGVVVADVNGDGRNEVIVANFGAGTLIGQDNTTEPASSISVFAGNIKKDISASAGKSPRGIAAGDLDGDGVADLVVTNYADGTITIITKKLAQSETIAVGKHPVGVAIGDLNGDGKNEIAVAVYSDNAVVILQKDANGAWQTTSVPVPGSPTDVAIGNISGQNVVVSANYSAATLSVIRYRAGTYVKAQDLKVGGGPCKVAIADVTGDGINDIIAANFYDNTISVIAQSASGLLADQVVYKLSGLRPNGMTVADINGDKLNDVIVAERDSDTIDILIQQNDGTLKLEQSLAVKDAGEEKENKNKDFGPVEVACGDIDGNGTTDIAFTHMRSNTVRILYQQGALDKTTGKPVFAEDISEANVYSYPNPCADKTTIRFSLSAPADVKILISDTSGKLVWHRELTAAETVAGINSIEWDVINDFGAKTANGVYIMKVITGKKAISKKIAVVK
jgi:hypothetical protein